jgi:hypothetical protein
MKFLVGNNTNSYSNRSRGYLLAEHMTESNTITSITELADNDIVKICLPEFSQELLDYLKENKISYILDVTDYKFHKDGLTKLYKEGAAHAIAVTTTCRYLADICKEIFNKDIYIIKDLTERKESKPTIRKIKSDDTIKIVWYGIRDGLKGVNFENIKSNLQEIHPHIKIKIITNRKDSDPKEWIQWSYDVQEEAVLESDIVLIPTASTHNNIKSKGNNRPIDGIRQGKFVITGTNIPSYHELKDFIFLGDFKQGLEFFLSYPEKVNKMILKGQAHITSNYSPQVIASKWEELESKLLPKEKL